MKRVDKDEERKCMKEEEENERRMRRGKIITTRIRQK
jgi:hypothetical protein